MSEQKTKRVSTMIRLRPDIREAAMKAAEADHRSLSGFIERLLAERLKGAGK